MVTLLLTWTIQPHSDILLLNVKDPQVRYKQYIATLTQYIRSADCEGIVFCENSGFEIADAEMLHWLAQQHGKKLEIIQFMGDHAMAVAQGRWAGENEIINHAIAHSKLIHDSGKFIKITGRYRCANINAIIHGSKKHDICFSKGMPVSLFHLKTTAVNTALFKTTVKFFNEILADAGKEVDDTHGIFIEHIYYKKLRPLAKKIHPLPQYPQMRWVTGEGNLLQKSRLVEAVIFMLHKLGINKI